MNTTAAIIARLASDATLTAQLATHNSAPAIFKGRAPDDFTITPTTKPFLVIAVPTDDRGADTFNNTGRAVQQDVRGYAPDTGSTAALDTAMRRVRDLFHNAEAALTITGGSVLLSKVTGPVESPVTDPSLAGRRVTLFQTIQDT